MAIQIPNPGTGNGATGDNEFVLWSKVKDNFSNTAHAASKLVGIASGQVPIIGNQGFADSGFFSSGEVRGLTMEEADVPSLAVRSGFYRTFTSTDEKVNSATILQVPYPTGDYSAQIIVGITGSYLRFRRAVSSTAYSQTYTVYHDGNTLKEEGTGHLYTSSPVILLRDGTMDKMHEAEDMDCELIKNGTGDYTLKNTTGLRDNEWHAVPPKDVHGNPLCMIVVTEPSEGEVNVKTYKRKFDFELAAVVADLEQPFDIPTGSSVRLHFNDLPQEQLDEPIE